MKQPQLGTFVTKLRKQKGLSQEELAIQCNMNIRSIQRVEACIVRPHLSTLKILSSVLEYDFLETGKEIKSQAHQLSLGERRFLIKFIHSTSKIQLPATFSFLYSAAIMLTGMVLLIFTFIYTLNHLNNDRVIYFIFLPGLAVSLILVLLGFMLFKLNKKQQEKKRLAGYIKKFILPKQMVKS